MLKNTIQKTLKGRIEPNIRIKNRYSSKAAKLGSQRNHATQITSQK